MLHLFLYSKGRESFAIRNIFAMHCIKSNFDKIMCVLKEVSDGDTLVDGNIFRPGPKPKFTDIEVVALSLTAECMGIDSELYLFAKLKCNYKDAFPNMISRRQYNDRRKFLFELIAMYRQLIASKLNQLNEVYAIDSMPLEICKLARMDRNKMGEDIDYAKPDKGFCAAQNKFYYGYKLHGLCSPSGVIQDINITRASVHDVQYLKDIKHVVSNCIITGDRGYINENLRNDLWDQAGICLEVPGRSNQKERRRVPYILKKIRKRIETVFSQLCDQFMIQRNYAKSFRGYRTRILSKVSGFTALQYINKYITCRPVGRVKYALYT